MSGPSQSWDVGDYQRHATFVPVLGEPLLAWLEAKPGESILDAGCGEGSLTLKIANSGAKVTGIDADPSMIRAAQAIGLDVVCMSASDMAYDAAFDAVFSNAALHWMSPPEKVVSNIHRALKQKGRFVAEMGGYGNTESSRGALHQSLIRRGIDPAAYDPWYFPTPDAYRSLLEKQGFRVLSMDHFARPTPVGSDIAGWLKTFAGSFLKALPEKEHAGFLEEVAQSLRNHLPLDGNGHYLLDYVRLRFKAVKL